MEEAVLEVGRDHRSRWTQHGPRWRVTGRVAGRKVKWWSAVGKTRRVRLEKQSKGCGPVSSEGTICSLKKYLLRWSIFYVPGTVLGTG